MNQSELILKVASISGESKKAVEAVLKTAADVITAELQEGGEAGLGVGDDELLVQDPGVGEAHLGHVLGLRHIDPHEEPIAPSPKICLEFAKALDPDCVWTDARHGASPSAGVAVDGCHSRPRLYRREAPFGSCHFRRKGIMMWESVLRCLFHAGYTT